MPWPEGDGFAAAAVVLTVLMMVVVVTVLMVVWLFVFRKGEKNVRASWLVGAWVFVLLFSFSSSMRWSEISYCLRLRRFLCDHLD